VFPPLFKLVDLLSDPVSGSYYQQQLKIAPNPNSDTYWTIEKVLKERKNKNGTKEQLVKFLFYPGKNIICNELIQFLFSTICTRKKKI